MFLYLRGWFSADTPWPSVSLRVPPCPSVLIWAGSQMLLVDSGFDGNRADVGGGGVEICC